MMQTRANRGVKVPESDTKSQTAPTPPVIITLTKNPKGYQLLDDSSKNQNPSSGNSTKITLNKAMLFNEKSTEKKVSKPISNEQSGVKSKDKNVNIFEGSFSNLTQSVVMPPEQTQYKNQAKQLESSSRISIANPNNTQKESQIKPNLQIQQDNNIKKVVSQQDLAAQNPNIQTTEVKNNSGAYPYTNLNQHSRMTSNQVTIKPLTNIKKINEPDHLNIKSETSNVQSLHKNDVTMPKNDTVGLNKDARLNEILYGQKNKNEQSAISMNLQKSKQDYQTYENQKLEARKLQSTGENLVQKTEENQSSSNNPYSRLTNYPENQIYAGKTMGNFSSSQDNNNQIFNTTFDKMRQDNFAKAKELLNYENKGIQGMNTANIDQYLRDYLVIEQPTIIPTFASWFDINKIHQLEKDSVAEFFEGKSNMKNPEYYMKIRNYIIQLYRMNPRAYLTATNCRKNLAGDACAIIRIHAFLEHWGLINFNFDPYNHNYSNITSKANKNPDIVGTKLDIQSQERALFDKTEPDKYFETIQSVSKDVRPVCNSCGFLCGFQWYERDQAKSDQTQKYNSSSYQSDVNIHNSQYIPDTRTGNKSANQHGLQIERSTIIENTTKMLDKETSMNVGAKLLICAKCYNAKNYPSIYSSTSFVQKDLELYLEEKSRNNKGKDWTNEETGVLQNHIKTSGVDRQNINNLFEKFPDRSREEVVYHFQNAPFEDITPLNIFDKRTDNKQIEEKCDALKELKKNEPKTFDDTNNLLMEHLAVFKILLDKASIKNEDKTIDKSSSNQNYLGKRSMSKFEKLGEIDEEYNSVIKTIESITDVDKKLLMDLRDEFKENSSLQKQKSELKLFEFVSVLCEMQMAKLENKIIFQDEYEKLLHHEKVFLKAFQNQVLAERLKLTVLKQQFY